jgi:type I restriction enzyme S subunit
MFYPFIPLTTGTTARRKLTQKFLMSAPYASPSIAEQRRIVQAVEMQISIWTNTSLALKSQTSRLQRLRQSILKWAFEGRLVDQDPTDERASALLERIRAERQEPA